MPLFRMGHVVSPETALGQVLGEAVGTGELDLTEAEQAGEAILRGNATQLYGL